VRVLNPVEDDNEFPRGRLLEIRIVPCGAHGNDPLMGRTPCQTIERGAGLEPDRHLGSAREVDDLLHAGSAGPLRYEHALQGPLCFQRLDDRMNAA
jgi:hypothetical protein